MARYRQLVLAAITPEETEAIRRHLQRQHVYGPDRLQREIQATLGRSAGPAKMGRPRKADALPPG